jgi:hypothetical protein
MKVTRSQRIAFQLVARTPLTKGIDGGLLPTPKAQECTETKETFVKRNGDRSMNCYPSLTSQLADLLLRTPSANPPGVKAERLSTKDGQPMKMGQRAYDKETGRLAQVGLEQQLAMLPTPQSRDFRSPDKPESGNFQRKVREGYTIDLNSTIAMLPTNRQRDWKGITQRGKHAPGDGIANTFAAMEANGASTGLKLQPAFAFWMMGYPEDWTLRPFLASPNTPPENGDGNHSKPPETPSSPK